jgi:predicted esterase
MRKLVFFFLMVVHLTGISQTKYDLQIPFEGRSREFIVSVPTKQPPQGGYPLVFMLHGSGGDKNVFYNHKGWKELGQQENFVTVFPSALRWCSIEDGNNRLITRFVCGHLLDSICPSEIPRLIDDVAFLKKLTTLIKDTLPINNNKVFISGFSNGSAMTHKMAMDAGDVFSAAGCMSAPLFPLDSIRPVRRIPIWFMVGTKDELFYNSEYPDGLPFNDSILYFSNISLNRALICQGLTSTFIKTETAISKTYTFSECRPGETCAPYIFSINKDQRHIYPNGTNFPVDAPGLYWNFFNNPPKTTTSTQTKERIIEASTMIMPNPSGNTITILAGFSAGTAWDCFIYDMQGRIVSKKQKINVPDLDLDIGQLPEGLYHVIISNKEYTVSRRLVKQF